MGPDSPLTDPAIAMDPMGTFSSEDIACISEAGGLMPRCENYKFLHFYTFLYNVFVRICINLYNSKVLPV
jgi:hypothetical protein